MNFNLESCDWEQPGWYPEVVLTLSISPLWAIADFNIFVTAINCIHIISLITFTLR